MSWKIENDNDNFILIAINLNNTKFRKNNLERLLKLDRLISTKKSIIIRAKLNFAKTISKYFYFLISSNNYVIKFKLFSSFIECLKPISKQEEECLWININKETYYSIFHWINVDNCNIFKTFNINNRGKFLIKLLDYFNIYFNVPYCRLSDEANINCDGEKIDLSLSYIFKYGITYYEKFGFHFDYNLYLKQNNLKLIKNKKMYQDTKHLLKNTNDFYFNIPKEDIPYFNNIIKPNSKSLGAIMTDLIRNDCIDYIDILEQVKKNKNIKNSIEIINDAKSSYIKYYTYY